MIYGFTHQGSGLGNQLHRYVATRVLALDKGYDFGMLGRFSFKGSSFMDLDMGKMTALRGHQENSTGKLIIDESDIPLWEEKTNYYNPEFNFIEDNTIIDGEFQSIQYFGHRMKEINEWLKVELIEIPDDTCIIGFRGGEFALFPELFLTREYWDKAIVKMREYNPNIKTYEIHTDDVETAKKFFEPLFYNSGYKVKYIHDIGVNWRSCRYAKYAIIANSSFYILPRLLNGGYTIAPRFWARRNIKEWSRPDNYYPCFSYI